MVVRSRSGEVLAFPVVQTIDRDSILSLTEAPAHIPDPLLQQVKDLAASAVACLPGARPICIPPALAQLGF